MWSLVFLALSTFTDGITVATLFLLVLWTTAAIPIFSRQFPDTSNIIIGGSIRLKEMMAQGSKFFRLRKHDTDSSDNAKVDDRENVEINDDKSSGNMTGTICLGLIRYNAVYHTR